MVSAQDETAYTAWMKGVPAQVADFWMKRRKDDAVQMARTTRDAAKEAAAATDSAAQTAAVAKVQATCGNCHRVYREGTTGAYKIKS